MSTPLATITNPTVYAAIKFRLTQGAITSQISQSVPGAYTVGNTAGMFPISNVNISVTLTGTVAHGSPLVLNLLSILDPQGNTVTFASVMAVIVQNSGILYKVVVGAGTNPVFGSDQQTIIRGGVALMGSPEGVAVVASSTQNLTLTAPDSSATGANAVAFTLTIIGLST